MVVKLESLVPEFTSAKTGTGHLYQLFYPILRQLTVSRLEGWFNVTTSSISKRTGKATSFSLHITIQTRCTYQDPEEVKGQ